MLRNYISGRSIRIVGVLALLVLALLFMLETRTARAETETGASWRTFLANNAHTGFNPAETSITVSTAGNLRLEWSSQASGMVTTQPVLSGGVVYWGSLDGYERATDYNGNSVWQTFLGQTTSTNCGNTAFGVASTATIAPTMPGGSTLAVFVGGGDAQFYALDVHSGAILWKTRLGASPNVFIWGSPAVYNGSVYIGTASYGDCPLVRSQLVKLNAATGAVQSRFYAVPQGCTGAGIWSAPTIDTGAGMVYISTGNSGTCSVKEPYAQAIVQLRASDLAVVGHWAVPANQLVSDSDFGATPTLFTFTQAGTVHRMVGVANKNGTYSAFRRGALGKGPAWTAQIAIGGECPECGDGSISSSAWDGKRLYIAGGNTTINGTSCPGGLDAVNPANGSFIWQRCLPDGPVLGAVSAVPGVIAVGEGSHVELIDATSGGLLFDYATAAGVWSPASILNGRLYVGDNAHNLYVLGF